MQWMRWGQGCVRALALGMLLTAGWGAAVAQEGVVATLASQVIATQDHQGLPFAIVDKRGATLSVYDGSGRLLASTAALLGSARGDYVVPGVASRVQTGLAPYERTTPGGRYVSEPGRNLKGEHVVWIDYDTALAIHRLRPAPANSREQRAQRLASATADDNRITLGCVVVPVAFYEQVVQPVLGQRRAVVYVLPESGSISELMAQTAH